MDAQNKSPAEKWKGIVESILVIKPIGCLSFISHYSAGALRVLNSGNRAKGRPTNAGFPHFHLPRWTASGHVSSLLFVFDSVYSPNTVCTMGFWRSRRARGWGQAAGALAVASRLDAEAAVIDARARRRADHSSRRSGGELGHLANRSPLEASSTLWKAVISRSIRRNFVSLAAFRK